MDDEMKQMEMDLGESGLMTSSETDPVSGNEVPPGALPEEVRDDVEANLSDGEYVVPSDVVRFFGVKFFEDLRNAAKEGLQDMDKGGRINGEEPEVDMLLVANPPQELRSEEVMMNEGGIVDGSKLTAEQIIQPQFKLKPQSMESDNFQTQQTESRSFVNAKGEKLTVLFANGMPMQEIPKGYVLDTKENRDALGLNKEAEDATPGYDGGDDGQNERRQAGQTNEPAEPRKVALDPANNPMNSEEALADWVDKGTSGFVNQGAVLGGVAGAILTGGLLGGAGGARKGDQLNDQAVLNAAARMAKARGWGDLASDYEDKANEFSNGLLGNLAATGRGMATPYIESYREGSNVSSATPSSNPVMPTAPSSVPTAAPTPGNTSRYSSDTSGDNGGNAPTASSRPTQRPSTTNTAATPQANPLGEQTQSLASNLSSARSESISDARSRADNLGARANATGQSIHEQSLMDEPVEARVEAYEEPKDEGDPRGFRKGGLVTKKTYDKKSRPKKVSKGLVSKR